ncbi:hypothetical protein [Paraburkholderia sp. Cpub6]|uniref:hypothetical protein n=1 Tax=Paraburkholderia sp. Cpub6 TaxID=2723094 RepID=UPI0016122A23|nr:hypothetical protein [Paraburkholderia sp. Cpub6]MBB5458692.1 hypothetical protein [Paraburkholderia sp. Cpub6]
MRNETTRAAETQTPQHDACTTYATDAAIVRLDQLHALAGLLSLEEVAEQFAGMSTTAQVALFDLFEDRLADIRAALASGMEVAHG